MNRYRRLASLALVLASIVVTSASAAQAAAQSPAKATFNGRVIDLAHGWSGARACVELGDRVECFREEAELAAAHPDLGGLVTRAAAVDSAKAPLSVTAASCSTSVALYRGTSFTGGVLFLTTRGAILNLSLYGFDNDTSSYKIGACSSSFYALSNAGGSVYPGNTSAFASSTVMSPGWDNAVSSIFIN
jgi:hypothetical protein